MCVCFVSPDVKQALIQWQERIDFAHKLLTLLNSYSPPELRNACLGKAVPGHARWTEAAVVVALLMSECVSLLQTC